MPWVSAALIALTAVPTLGGALRLRELAIGAEITAENARFFASPEPLVLHIVASVLFGVLGALQFAPGLRGRWHRRAGVVVAVAGFTVALSGLWMTVAYPRAPGDHATVFAMRLLAGGWMTVSLVRAVMAIGRRDFAAHGAWMIRGYAIGLGAGTQVLTFLPYFALAGRPGEVARAVLLGAGWVINVIVAERILRGGSTSPRGAADLALGSRAGRTTPA